MRRIGCLLGVITALCSIGWAQQTANLDFLAILGELETDFNRDGRHDSLVLAYDPPEFLQQVQFAIDLNQKFSGAGSQRIQLQRDRGELSWMTFYRPVDFNAHLKPLPDEPLLIRFAYRTEAFTNADYWISILVGDETVRVVPLSRQASGEWREMSVVVPARQRADGTYRVLFEVGIRAQPGAASGTLWIDKVQALSTRSVSRASQLPNGLKLCWTYLYRNRDHYRYLENLPLSLVMGDPQDGTVMLAHYPSTKFLIYTLFSGTVIPESLRHSHDLYDYDDLVSNHPDWFLYDRNGNRIPLDHTYYVDIGRPEVRERAWQKLRDFLNRSGRPRYVILDNVDMRVGPDRFAPPNYPTNDMWVQAILGWFEHVGSRLRAEFNTTFIPSVSWAPGFWLRGRDGTQDAPGVATLPYVGGFIIEHAFTHARSTHGETNIMTYGTTSNFGNWRAWTLRDTIRLATEYPERIVILIPTLWLGQPDTTQKLRFAIAGCLIVQHNNTYIQIDPRRQQDQHPAGFYPPELFVPLGRWTENFRVLNGDIISGGLFVRNYENGVVVWNPTHDRDFTFTVPRDLYDWDRNLIRAGTVVQIPRQTGHVFYSAPEISLELSPQNAQVLPGQTVQFTVTYRNRGTAPGTNVRIAVPLPQGMTLVGSNPAARLENGQVVWTIPNVPVGGQGTLQFTVRVE